MARSWFIAVLIGLLLAGCAGQSPEEPRDGAAPNKDEKTGGETTLSEVKRAVLTGVLTAVDRGPGGESGTVGSILVEEPPGAGCGEGPADPGCEKIYFQIIAETRVFREQGGERVEASPGDLEKGQRVRADYTGYPLAESYPAQTTARTVVILSPASSSDASDAFFPKQRPGGDMMMADIRGEFLLDDEGCLRVAGNDRVVPIWPADFSVDREDGQVRVLNSRGRVVARVGEEVYMGGGEVGRSLEGIAGVEKRCSGTYWLVGTGVTIP